MLQVEVAVREGESSPGGERSEELVVDTGRAVVVELEAGTGAGARWATGEGPSRVPAGAGSRELILGVASALALFVLVSLVVLVRTRSTGPTTAKLLPYHQQIHSHAGKSISFIHFSLTLLNYKEGGKGMVFPVQFSKPLYSLLEFRTTSCTLVILVFI